MPANELSRPEPGEFHVFHYQAEYGKHPDQYFFYHSLLFRILRGEVAAAGIQEFWCDEACTTDTGGDILGEESTVLKPLVRRAVQASPWIDDTETEAWVEKVCAGDEDATLGVLIPMLDNLHSLAAPIEAKHLNEIVKRIAIASCSNAHAPLALGKLVMVRFFASNGNEGGMQLQDVVPYAAIPSVKRLFIPHSRSNSKDGDFTGWPVSIPFSRATDVYFPGATVVPADVRKFGQGFIGPCIMRQYWRIHGSWMPETGFDAEWDHYEIGAGGTEVQWQTYDGKTVKGIQLGTRTESLELRYEEAHEDPSDGPSSKYSPEINAMMWFDPESWDWRDITDDAA